MKRKALSALIALSLAGAAVTSAHAQDFGNWYIRAAHWCEFLR